MVTASLSFDDPTIPADLEPLRQWVCWKAIPNGDRLDKIPVCASTLRNASTTDPDTWTDYSTAARTALTNEGLGLGFVFTKESGITGIDLDKCRDADTGTLEPWAEEIVRALNSYTEISPSEKGLHIFVRGALPPGRRKKGRTECYEEGRFFTVTGRHLEQTPDTIEDRTAQLLDFHARSLADPVPVVRPAPAHPRLSVPLADADILDKCRTARNSAKFDALWRGDVTGYPSHSEADLALLSVLSFYTQDESQLDRLYRQSGLQREKWDKQHGENTYGAMTIRKALATVRETYTPSSANGHPVKAPSVLETSTPALVIPLDDVRLPDLTLDTFPDPLGPMIDAVAKATETPVELPALMGLATVAASCQQVFEVEMEPGYFEPLCVWAIAALQSGNRKTAVHSAMTNPLRKKERELCNAAKAKRLTVESERATIEARVKGLRSRLANSEDFEHAEEMKQEITKLETTLPPVPTIPSLWAQDVTPEKLGTMMADNGERLAILSDEGGFFDILTGRYSNGIPNLDTCLQAHSCSPVKVNRGGRDEVHMQRPTLTMGLSPQPCVLRDLTNKSLLRDRGFLARVLFALPTSRLGFRTLHSHPISPAIETAYHRMVEALLAFQPPTNEDGQPAAYRLKPSPEAHREWKEFARTVERDMRPGAQYEHMTDWAGKLPGAAVRVAGLFHCVQQAHAQPHTVPISLDTMQRALGVLAVLSQHALAVFDLMGADPALDGARKVWRWIDQGRRPTFTARECFQVLRGTFHRIASLDQAFAVLCERGYLIEGGAPRRGPGRPSRLYTINPTLTQGWV